MPAIAELDEDRAPIPRRAKFVSAPRAWWRPGSTVGRVFLGIGATAVLGALAAGAYVTRQFLTSDSMSRSLDSP